MNKFFGPVAVVFGSIWLVAMLQPADLIQVLAAVGGGGLIGLCLSEAILYVWDSMRMYPLRIASHRFVAKLRRKGALRRHRQRVAILEAAKLSACNDSGCAIYGHFGNKNTVTILGSGLGLRPSAEDIKRMELMSGQ